MTVAGLISNSINHGRNACYTSRVRSYNELEIIFKLPVPAWFNDSVWVTNENTRVLYNENKKKGLHACVVDIKNINDGYPTLSNNKSLCYYKRYSVEDFSKQLCFSKFLTAEREIIFREVKSNITLEKIGHLSKKYSMEVEGKYYNELEEIINYADSKFSPLIDRQVYPPKEQPISDVPY